MSEPSDPLRLADDANAGRLRDWLREGQGELPSEQQLARLSGRLEHTFAAPVAHGAPLSKLLLGGLGVAGVALLALTLRAPREAPREVSKASEAVSAPAAPATSQAPAVLPSSAPSAAPDAPSAASAAHVGKASPKLAPSEAALLEQARAALASDPARALSLTRQHQARFPSGVLKQEREVIAIEALRRLGQSKAASERAGSFEQAYPDSAHRRAVESGLSK
jgi:hypothetical protein